MRGDLRQMRDDDDLGVASEPGQALADGESGTAADPRVDLVEDEHGGRGTVAARGGQGDLQGEHHAGELTARGGLGDGQVLGARVGCQQDGDRVPSVRAVGLGGDVDTDRGVRHLEMTHLLLDRGGQGLRGGGPRLGQSVRGRIELALQRLEPGRDRRPFLLRTLEAVQIDGRTAGGLQQGADVLRRAVGTGQHGAEVADQHRQLVQPFVGLLDPSG